VQNLPGPLESIVKGWIESRRTGGGVRWDACWRTGSKKKSRTFERRKDAEKYLTAVVKHVHDGGYIDTKPMLMDKVFDEWLMTGLEDRVTEGTLKISTAKSYRSMVEEHLRPMFGHYRSDRLTLLVIEEWRRQSTEKIAAGTMTVKFHQNQRNLLHAITDWARHPARQYLAHDPLSGLPKLRLSRARKRPFFEPDQVAAILAIAAETPPNDVIIRVAALSGLRRGELFALQWIDVEEGNGHDGGQIHVRRRLYQGDLDTPKTDGSDRNVDVPQRLLDDLAIYRLTYPPIGEAAFIFRTATGQPIDADNWQKRRFIPILRKAGLYRRGTGLHALRHGYVSLLAAQGEDVHYISGQIGHASVRLTQDVYRHTFTKARTEAMRRLNTAIPSGSHPAEPARTIETGENTEE
jgi:integrase